MKVFNVTDEPTSALQAQGLVNQHLKVGDTIIPRGGSAVIRGTARELSELTVFIKVGAVAIDELPVAYAAARGLSVYGEPLNKPEPKLEKEETVMVEHATGSLPAVPDLTVDLPRRGRGKKDE